MPDAPSLDALGLTAALDALARSGLDLARPFDAVRYNHAVASHPTLRRLPLFGREHALGVILGNTRRMWPLFLRAYEERADLRNAAHPLDRYVEEAVGRCLALVREPWVAHFAHLGGEARVSMVHAADVAGLASLGPAHLAVHAEHGPWIGLRALLVFDAPPPPELAPAAPSPCAGCAAPCLAALDAALREVGARPTGQGDIASTWRRWVAVRDACPVGRSSRYGERQLRYHYLKDRSALEPRSEERR